MPTSPTSSSLNRRLRQPVVEIVWHITPSGVFARACMPTNTAASQPVSNISV